MSTASEQPTGSANTADAMLTPEEAEHYRKALEQPVCDLPAAKLPERLAPERIAELRPSAERWREFQETGKLSQYDGMPMGAPDNDRHVLAAAAPALLDALAASQAENERLKAERDELREWQRQQCRQNPD